MRRLIVLVVALLLGPELTTAETITNSVSSFEDELIEALSRGEIDQVQYDALVELLESGAGIDRQYLVDNLARADYLIDSISNAIPTHAIQLGLPEVSTNLDYRSSYELTEARRSRYRFRMSSSYRSDLMVTLSIRKEFTGRERFSRRQLVWRPRATAFHEIRLGNFSERYANGLLVGYRGKILDFSDKLDGESFAYPDYGGFNGLSGGGKIGGGSWHTLWSTNRDTELTHNLYAVGIKRSLGVLTSGVNFSWNQLSDRAGGKVNDYKGSLFGRYGYARGFLSFESAIQGGEYGSSAAIVESALNGNLLRLKTESWYYGDEYLDLSTGARSSALSRVVGFPELELELRSRRSGQIGSLLNLSTRPLLGLRWENSLVAASIGNDSNLVQNLMAVRKEINLSVAMKLDFLHKSKETADAGGYSTNRVRLEIGGGDEGWDWRTYLGFSDGNKADRSVAWFGRCRYHRPSGSEYELWLNFGRMDAGRKQLDYFYGFFSNDQLLCNNFSLGLKIAHRYSRSSTNHHRTTVSISLRRLLR
ncbi:MAG: hypothetical protein P1R58_00430 [bacterium]|nr:hypothetical protein [bacterium]